MHEAHAPRFGRPDNGTCGVRHVFRGASAPAGPPEPIQPMHARAIDRPALATQMRSYPNRERAIAISRMRSRAVWSLACRYQPLDRNERKARSLLNIRRESGLKPRPTRDGRWPSLFSEASESICVSSARSRPAV